VGFLDEGNHLAVVVGGDDPKREGSSTGAARSSPHRVSAVERQQRREVEVGQHVAVDHEERLIEPELRGRESNRAGRVQGSGSTA